VKSKNHKPITPFERAHLAAVKLLPCSVCDAPAPSAAHHAEQQNHFTTVALCADCHQGSLNGWHGQKRMWHVMHMNENDALNVTIRRLVEAIG
jgi:cytochrome c553